MAPTCEFIGGKKSAKAEGVFVVSATLESGDVVSWKDEKYVVKGTHGYGRYVRLISQIGDVFDAKVPDVTPLHMRSGIYIE